MSAPAVEGRRTSKKVLLRRWVGYALGIAIEVSAVIAISLAALLLMYIIKAIIS